MKKIILDATAKTAACFPLTVLKPNALLSVFNKTLLEHCIENRCKGVFEIIIIVEKEFLSLFTALVLPPFCLISTDKSHMMGDVILASLYYAPNGEVFDIKYAWNLIDCVERYGREAVSGFVSESATVESGATLNGQIQVGEGTVIKNGSYLEGNIVIGRNCTIGPNCYIRGNCSIGDDCRIGNAVELKNVIIGKRVNICHLSYLGDGIVDDFANLGAGFICSNLRHDGAEMVTMVNGEKVNTKRKKLGAIIGYGVHTGVRTTVYPGRKIAPYSETLPCEIVDKDILLASG